MTANKAGGGNVHCGTNTKKTPRLVISPTACNAPLGIADDP